MNSKYYGFFKSHLKYCRHSYWHFGGGDCVLRNSHACSNPKSFPHARLFHGCDVARCGGFGESRYTEDDDSLVYAYKILCTNLQESPKELGDLHAKLAELLQTRHYGSTFHKFPSKIRGFFILRHLLSQRRQSGGSEGGN